MLPFHRLNELCGIALTSRVWFDSMLPTSVSAQIQSDTKRVCPDTLCFNTKLADESAPSHLSGGPGCGVNTSIKSSRERRLDTSISQPTVARIQQPSNNNVQIIIEWIYTASAKGGEGGNGMDEGPPLYANCGKEGHTVAQCRLPPKPCSGKHCHCGKMDISHSTAQKSSSPRMTRTSEPASEVEPAKHVTRLTSVASNRCCSDPIELTKKFAWLNNEKEQPTKGF